MITFVLMTCGELAEKDCLAAIAPFRDQIVFQEVRNICPQIKALNQMIAGVQTEFFVPLDSDMVLNPDAFQRITAAVEEYLYDQRWHSILFPLWDTLTDRKILALKVLKTRVMKANVFMDSPTPDVEHFQRLTQKGYVCIDKHLNEPPIGRHVVKGKHFCYFKYRDVYQTYRMHGFEWDNGAFMGGNNVRERSKAHFDFFIKKWVEKDEEDYLHCIAGMLDGLTSPLEGKSKTLGVKSYKVDSLKAAGQYLEWYDSGNIPNQELLLF